MFISKERRLYLKKIRKENIIVSLARFLIVFIFIIGWEVLARMELINTFTFSSPSRIIETIIGLLNNGGLFSHIRVTLYETLYSFFLATVIGIIIATLLWSNKIISRIIDPYLTILNSLPKVALGPLIIIWVGASTNSIIFMALLISTFITIINIYSGFINTENKYIVLMKSFGANKWQIFRKVVFPSNYTTIINSLKVNISMSLIGLLPPVGENLNSNKYYSKYLSHYL